MQLEKLKNNMFQAVRSFASYFPSRDKNLHEIKEILHEIRQLVGPFGVPMLNNEILVQSLFNIKYFIDATDTIMAPTLIVYRQWEPELSKKFAEIANKDLVFIDVGANFGYFSCLLGSLIGNNGTGRIFAFEPNPTMVRLLEKNISVNWSMCPIDVYAAAVTNSTGTIKFHVPAGLAANASIANSQTFSAAHTVFDVACVTLDNIIPSDVVVDVIKMDIEGYELHALKGAKNVISRSKNIRIVMEWSRDQMNAAKILAQDVFNFADDNGLRFYNFDNIEKITGSLSNPLSLEQLMDIDYGTVVLGHASP